MKWILLLAGVVVARFLAANAPSQVPIAASQKQRTPVYTETLNDTHELIGPLGKPLGEVLTVLGKVEEIPQKAQEHFLTVTEVNGTPLRQAKQLPARLWPWANIKDLRPGQQLRLRVYQDGGMVGVPHQAMAETVFIQTQGHGFATWLVVIGEVRDRK
jgi:hypothetical protein